MSIKDAFAKFYATNWNALDKESAATELDLITQGLNK